MMKEERRFTGTVPAVFCDWANTPKRREPSQRQCTSNRATASADKPLHRPLSARAEANLPTGSSTTVAQLHLWDGAVTIYSKTGSDFPRSDRHRSGKNPGWVKVETAPWRAANREWHKLFEKA